MSAGKNPSGNVRLFENHFPQFLQSELAIARALHVKPLRVGEKGFDEVIDSDKVKWAIDANGVLKVIPKRVGSKEIKHSVITGGKPVLAAGEAYIAGSNGTYYLLDIDNNSGHFLPSSESLQLGINAFAAAGVIVSIS